MSDTQVKTRAVLDSVVAVARPIILERFHQHSCVASTRIAIDVLDYFGIEAKPLSVKLHALNAKAWEAVSVGDDPDFANGAWGVGIGPHVAEQAIQHRTSNGVDAHLVALVEDTWLMDLSADQVARPHKDIYAEPYYARVTAANLVGFREREEGLVFADSEGHGTRLVYWLLDDPFWKGSPDWEDRSRRKDLVGRIIRETKKRLVP